MHWEKAGRAGREEGKKRGVGGGGGGGECYCLFLAFRRNREFSIAIEFSQLVSRQWVSCRDRFSLGRVS